MSSTTSSVRSPSRPRPAERQTDEERSRTVDPDCDPDMTRVGAVLTTRGRAFLAAGLTLLGGGLLLGFTDITRVGVLLSALPLLADLRARRHNSRVAVTRTVHPARLMVDQSARVSMVLENSSGRRTP